MIVRATRIVLAASAALLLAGCITTVDVKKVEPGSNDKGLRYSLPATFLLMQPQADGSATYTWVHMPDPERTYAIKQHAILSKFTLDVATSNGLLTSAQSFGDNTAVAGKLLEAAQAAKVADITARSAGATKDATAAAAASTAERTARIALAQAKAEQVIVDDPVNASKPEEKRAAAVKVSNAQIAYDHALSALAALGLTPSATNLPAVGGGTSGATQWGPVLFRLGYDSAGKLELRAVNVQTTFETVGAPGGGGGTAPAAGGPKLTLKDPMAVRTRATRPLVLVATSDQVITNVVAATSTLTRDGNRDTSPFTVDYGDGKTLTFTFAGGLLPGSYAFSPALVAQSGSTPSADNTLEFSVQ